MTLRDAFAASKYRVRFSHEHAAVPFHLLRGFDWLSEHNDINTSAASTREVILNGIGREARPDLRSFRQSRRARLVCDSRRIVIRLLEPLDHEHGVGQDFGSILKRRVPV